MLTTENRLTIPIGLEALENPARLHLSMIEATMLWPSDKAAREAALTTAAIEHSAPYVDGLEPEDLRLFAELSRLSFPLDHIRHGALTPFRRGAIAGMVLRECVGRVALGHTITLAAEFRRVAGDTVTKKIFDNDLWPSFRPVAPLWAAWLDEALDGNPAFPCEIGGIRGFLETAEAYRIAAEGTRTRQSPKPLMAPGAAIRLAPELEIVPSKLSFQERDPKK